MRRFVLLFAIGLKLLSSQTMAAPAEEIDAPPERPSSAIPQEAFPNLNGSSENFFEIEEQPDATLPEIQRDFSRLPPAVAKTRTALMEAARNADIESLRSLLQSGEEYTQLSVSEDIGDPIDHLRSLSGDEAGFEILAILLEVLEAGFVKIDEGTADELYVWPYFAIHPLDTLSPVQKVELFQLLTAGDLQESQEFGSYIFYRLGIKKDGSWAFFVSGD